MAETLPLDKFKENFDNVYEAIVAVAKRSRQINELQKRILDKEAEALAEENDLELRPYSEDMVEAQFLKLPKPTIIATKEILEGKLTGQYPEKED